jgi:rod shape-determining protein MreD
MHLKRLLLSTFLVVAALILQVSVLARLQLPGAVPDLMLLVVLGLAIVYGHTAGALVGFGAGLLADIAPPADHAVGRYALVLCVIGYAVGLTKPDSGQHRSAAVPMLAVAGSAIASTFMYWGVGALVGDTAARQVGIVTVLLTAILYDLLLAPFAVPLVMWLARRTERDPLATEKTGNGGTATGGARAYGWLTSGTGLQTGVSAGGKDGGLLGKYGRPGRRGLVRNSRNGTGKAARLGIQRGSLLGKQGRVKSTKVKGVKRL